MDVKTRKTGGKQLAPAKRARAAPREAEASVAFESAGADDSDESEGEESDHSGDDAAREALDGEHVVDMDDSVAFEHAMKKATKNVKRKKKLLKKFASDASGMTGVSEGCWGMVAC
jgi:hypothetical protein